MVRDTLAGGTTVVVDTLAGGPGFYRSLRDCEYERLVWAAQLAYLDATEGETDARVQSRLLLITRLLSRWQRGW